MAIEFDGKKIRDGILADLKTKFAVLSSKPTLAVIWIGDDKVSARYIEQKRRAAELLGVHFDIFKFSDEVAASVVAEKIKELNESTEITGIMIQLPIPKNLDQQELITTILSEKDVDALRFCSEITCTFRPPVILAIMEALKASGIDHRGKKVAIIGKGFLVGSPLSRHLQGDTDLRVADDQTPNLSTITIDADIVISATGHAGLIRPDMIKNGAVLIDAGTAELGGKLVGDIDPRCYKKSAFYTPVPGGIGPMTVAVLFKNLFSAAKRKEK